MSKAYPIPRPGRGQGGDRRLGALTSAVAWMMIIVMTVANLDFSSASATPGEANPVTRAVWFVILGVSAVLVAMRVSLVARLVKYINVFYLLFFALAAASVLWSIDPDQTLARLLRLPFMWCAFLAIALVGWNRNRFQEVLRPVMTFLILGSLLLGVVRPDIAIHSDPDPLLFGSWRGLFFSKNDLGPAASVCFILWLHALVSRQAGRFKALAALAAAAACLILSQSSTSLLATVITSLALVLLMRTPGSRRHQVSMFATGLLVLVLLISIAMLKVVPGLEIILAPVPLITGKDLTFTGRSEIWDVVLDHIQRRPILGSGYSAYWLLRVPTPQDESYEVLARIRFYPGSCHNGYLQVLNDLGYVGLACLIGYIGVYLRQALRLFALDREQGALFLAFLTQQAINNLAEPLWMNVLLVDFVWMSLATFCMARALMEPGYGLQAPHSGPRPAARPASRLATAGPRPPGLRRLVRGVRRDPG